jgi:hypothetical protein
VALTARHQGYGGTQGSDDGAGRFSRAAPAEPTAASVSALGMARMLPTPTFVAPPTFQPFGNGG